MCRWLGYSGGPVLLDEMLFKPEISLIDQSMSARMGVKPTNGDGFGVGWYGTQDEPGVYRAVQPAWNDENLRILSEQIESPLFMAHVRRSTGTSVQQSNCHPFHYRKLLFVHNGLIRDLPRIKRDLALAIDPELYPCIMGNTDSELMFYLALTFGLEMEPLAGLERMVGFVERVGRDAGIEFPMQGSLGLTDGAQLMAVRYSSEGESRSLFHSECPKVLRELYPDHPRVDVFPDDARAIVSEPLSDMSGVWNEVPESSCVVVGGGSLETLPFEPRAP